MALSVNSYWKFIVGKANGQTVNEIHSINDFCRQAKSDLVILNNIDLNDPDIKTHLFDIKEKLNPQGELFASSNMPLWRLRRSVRNLGLTPKADFWVYQDKGKVIWILPLKDRNVFLFSLGEIIKDAGERRLKIKAAIVKFLYKLGLLRFLVSGCVVATRQ